jgi:hypothetical protein
MLNGQEKWECTFEPSTIAEIKNQPQQIGGDTGLV